MGKCILLAGGAGYIGTHTAVALCAAGFDVVVADNFSNSCAEAVHRAEKLAGRSIPLYEMDVRDNARLLEVMNRHSVDCVIHFAGLKAVGESVRMPLRYYRNNIDTTLSLLECMEQSGCRRIIFSSSATVYGESAEQPSVETMPRGVCTNPYGWTKSMMEQIFEDAVKADRLAGGHLSVVLLRYFNPVGAHPSGMIGEDPSGVPNNLMPYISQVAVGRRKSLTVFGDDYPTPDGTCRRDFIHVMDLAEGHAAACRYVMDHEGLEIFNLGTGTPCSVKEMLDAFSSVNHVAVPHTMGARREGDVPEVWANADKAARMLGWHATRTLEDMCRDSWNWQSKNPGGYAGTGD